MAPATIGILHCNIRHPILASMLALKAIRAILVVMGLVAFVPAQAANVAAQAEAVMRSCTQCSVVASADRKAVPVTTSKSQNAQACQDDGFAPGSPALPSSADFVTGRPRFALPPVHAPPASARLDRPPKAS